MATTVATLSEQRQAKVFLSLLHAPTNNNQLIIAVVAWMRLTGRTWDARLMAQRILTSSVYTPVSASELGPYGYAVAETNQLLQRLAATYKLVIAAARNGLAVDFLIALAETNLSPTHYGVTTNYADPRQNQLLAAYSGFTGLQLPAQEPLRPPASATPKPPKIPTVLQPPPSPATADYLDPYASARFYWDRHSRTLQTVDDGR
ncbi:MAG TPA: hypothetical protein VFI40_04950 [Nocardioides sp.]|nr:hypothetical protein [Nocardioides sp.]